MARMTVHGRGPQVLNPGCRGPEKNSEIGCPHDTFISAETAKQPPLIPSSPSSRLYLPDTERFHPCIFCLLFLCYGGDNFCKYSNSQNQKVEDILEYPLLQLINVIGLEQN